jgi:N-acetyl-gamma-glutamyl-phosphate reductase
LKSKIFIDGDSGTTGLGIRDRLAGRTDLELIALPQAQRKDLAAKQHVLSQVDLTILCLPDEAAK